MTPKNLLSHIVSVILVLITTIWGKPACRTRFRTEVVCVAGKDDYILQRGLVSDNNNTVAITLKDCRIRDIDMNAFQNVHHLEEIDLSRNKITDLKLGVFDEVSKLISLRLSNNLLKSFPLGIFDNLTNLQRLDFSDNFIDSLEVGLFNNMPKLVRLELSGNAFLGKHLEHSIFDQNPKIKYLHFSNNNMSGAPELLLNAIQELSILGLNNCSLTEVPKFLDSKNLVTIKQLSLRKNQIKSVDDPEIFVNLKNLLTLDMMGNNIEVLNDKIFSHLSKLRSIDMSLNKIQQIPEHLFHNMHSLKYIYLSKNLIEFIPVNAFRGTNIYTLDVSRNRISFLDNNFISKISCCGITTLKDLYFKGNPFQCPCLLEIMSESKKFDIKLDANNLEEYAGCINSLGVSCVRPVEERYPKANNENDLWASSEVDLKNSGNSSNSGLL